MDDVTAQRISYDDNQRVDYLGWSKPGIEDDERGWMIVKIEYDDNDNVVARKWASGNNNKDKIWDNRANYTYV